MVNELNGEKVDIIPFSEDPYDFVAKALSPAKVKEVRIDFDTATAEVIVPDFQLSLAIGKEGQNARLAHRLTGWRIDIKSETQLEEEAKYAGEEWAEGEWIVDPESGEQMWQPADGSEAISADEWNAATDDDADGESSGDAETGDAATEAEAEAEGSDAEGSDTDGDSDAAAEDTAEDAAEDAADGEGQAEESEDAADVAEDSADDAAADDDTADADADAEIDVDAPAEESTV